MFTGIVRELGLVVSVENSNGGLALEIEAPATAPKLSRGDSLAVDGVCLTAETVTNGRVTLHAVPETLARTTLVALAPGIEVNLEVDVLAKYVERLLR